MTLAAASYTWYAARAGGVLAFLLLTASVVAGLLLSGRAKVEGWPRFALEDVHRFLGLLAGAFILLHGAALLADGYLPFSLTDLLVPGTAPYRPLAVALGVVAAELLAALAIANHFRRELSYRFWRRMHYLNFAVWTLALAHGLAAGTDSTTPWALAFYVGSAGAVVGLTVRRAVRSAPLVWAGAGALAAAELIVALAFGPLRHHGGG